MCVFTVSPTFTFSVRSHTTGCIPSLQGESEWQCQQDVSPKPGCDLWAKSGQTQGRRNRVGSGSGKGRGGEDKGGERRGKGRRGKGRGGKGRGGEGREREGRGGRRGKGWKGEGRKGEGVERRERQRGGGDKGRGKGKIGREGRDSSCVCASNPKGRCSKRHCPKSGDAATVYQASLWVRVRAGHPGVCAVLLLCFECFGPLPDNAHTTYHWLLAPNGPAKASHVGFSSPPPPVSVCTGNLSATTSTSVVSLRC